MINPYTTSNRMLKWQKTRKMGKFNFSIRYGLFLGFFCALAFPFIDRMWPIHEEQKSIDLIKQIISFESFLRFLLTSFVMALIYYKFGWDGIEKKYKKWLIENNPESTSVT